MSQADFDPVVRSAATRRVLWLSCAALYVPLCAPMLTGRIFVYDDLAAQNLPIRHLYREALRAGDSILWSPSLFSGVYLFGEGQTGMAHPFHWLLYRVLPLELGINIELLSSYIFALEGMRRLLRKRTSESAAVFGAMLFAFSGFNLLHLSQMNVVAVGAHLPWLLLATHRLITATNRLHRGLAFAGIALLVGSEALLGYPQSLWMTLLADGCFVAWLLRKGAPLSGPLYVALAVSLGCFIGGVQLLPSLDVLQHSVRAVVSPEFRSSFSLPPIALAQMWSPYLHPAAHDSGLYNGAFCTVAIAWLGVRWPHLPQRDLLRALLVFAALMLLLALGPVGVIYPLLARLPGLDRFRAPARYVLLIHFALAGVAAFVFDDLIDLAQRRDRMAIQRLWPVAALAGLALATTLAGPWLRDSSWARAHGLTFSSFSRSSVGLLFVLTTFAAVVLIARGWTAAVPALVVLVAFDIGLWGFRYSWRITPPMTLANLRATASVPANARAGEYLLPLSSQAQKNLPVLRGFRLSSGYLGLMPKTTLQPDDELAQRLAGVTWQFSDAGWVRVPNPVARARLISAARVSNRIEQDIRTIDVERVALVDTPLEGLTGFRGSAHVRVDRPGHIVVNTTAPAPQLLVLTERFEDGWTAQAGSKACPTRRVYGDYLGCVVEAGTHEVVFEFAPKSVRNGLALTIVGLILTASATWYLARRTR